MSTTEFARSHAVQAPQGKLSPLLTVAHVSKGFDDRLQEGRANVAGPNGRRGVAVLQDLSFEVDSGEIVCLVGPSGSGKSTLLRIIAGLTPTDQGQITFDDTPIREPHPAIGLVFQRTNLMPWRTVIENVLLPVEVQQGHVDAAMHARAQKLLELVHLQGFEHHYPKQLSGGMAQRVVLARTLLQQPQLLLLDEPFGALDALTRERLNVELLRLQVLQRQTVVMVTHSIAEAVFLADRVLVLSARPGRLIAEVPIMLPRPRELALLGTAEFAAFTQAVRRHIDQSDHQDSAIASIN